MTDKSKRTGPGDKPLLARRAIIKGAAGTVPTILSLQSGAALARSSNLIREANDATDELGRTLCLSARSVDAVYPNGQIDLGPNGYGYVTAIRERDYYSRPSRGSTPVSEEQMCKTGNTAYYKRMGWREAQAQQGWLVSANSLGSFANIKINEI